MYQIKQESLNNLNEVSKRLWSKLETSVFWPILKDEPIIKEFLAALADVEAQCKPRLCNLCGNPEHEGACYEK